jgi:hypothetical protein
MFRGGPKVIAMGRCRFRDTDKLSRFLRARDDNVDKAYLMWEVRESGWDLLLSLRSVCHDERQGFDMIS